MNSRSTVTSSTITDHEALVDDILPSRRMGYFLTRGENVSDVWAVSAFLTVNRETIAVAIAGPRHRMEGNLAECAQLLVATCSLLSRQQARG
ncbi:MAG: IclR family transcriptional regulator C-terminal domain-containing protein [Burkholderiaceae bacterium]|jgi:IclR family acetate operon transcriptional repressor|nr:IclR family transcriptional regulator C-terminal domain-containing protein [Burkholderiaceae bacterium]